MLQYPQFLQHMPYNTQDKMQDHYTWAKNENLTYTQGKKLETRKKL